MRTHSGSRCSAVIPQGCILSRPPGGKAYTAVGFAPLFKADSSGEVAERITRLAASQPPDTLPFQPPEHMIFRAGGLTIKLGDEVIGAIGVGGAPNAQADEACARAGLDKIRDRIR